MLKPPPKSSPPVTKPSSEEEKEQVKSDNRFFSDKLREDREAHSSSTHSRPLVTSDGSGRGKAVLGETVHFVFGAGQPCAVGKVVAIDGERVELFLFLSTAHGGTARTEHRAGVQFSGDKAVGTWHRDC